MNRIANETVRSAKRISLNGNTYRSPAGTKTEEGPVTVINGWNGGSVMVMQGEVTERWHRVCERA